MGAHLGLRSSHGVEISLLKQHFSHSDSVCSRFNTKKNNISGTGRSFCSKSTTHKHENAWAHVWTCDSWLGHQPYTEKQDLSEAQCNRSQAAKRTRRAPVSTHNGPIGSRAAWRLKWLVIVMYGSPAVFGQAQNQSELWDTLTSPQSG